MKKPLLTSCIFLFAAISTFLLLTSCERYKDILNLNSDEEVKQYDLRIVVSVRPDNTPWRNSVLNWAWKAREEFGKAQNGVAVEVILARDDEEQLEQLRLQLAKERVDALVILVDNPEVVASACRDFRQKNTIVVAVHNNIVFPQYPNFLVTGDNNRIGQEGANAIVKALSENNVAQGKILAFSNFSNPAIANRYASFRENLTQYMKLQVIEVDYHKYGKTPYDAMVDYLKQNGPVDAIWTGWDSILEDVVRACNSEGVMEEIKVLVGGNGSKAINRMILAENSKVSVNMTYPPKMMYDAIMLAFDKLTNSERSDLALAPPEFIVIPSEVITKDNVKNYMTDPESF